uniref:F-box domain-containing protein n=1 Tax=Strongyloides venezuelensis TaxID=75913 RepID=A0A0K0EUQ2_STRVS
MDQTEIANDAISQKHILAKIINNMDSLTDMTNFGRTNKFIYSKISKCKIKKFLDLEIPYYTMYVTRCKDTSEMKIFCKSSKLITSTVEEEIERLREVPLEHVEKASNITIWFTGWNFDLSKEMEDFISDICASFIDFLFNIFVNSFTLRLHFSSSPNIKAFQLCIIKKLRSPKIKIIKGVTIENVLNYLDNNKNVDDDGVFEKTKNLKELWLHLGIERIKFIDSSSIENKISIFLKSLSSKNKFMVTLCNFTNGNNNAILIKFISLCEKNNIKIMIDGFPSSCLQSLIKGSYREINFSRKNIIGLKINIMSEKQCQHLNNLFTSLNNLETLHIFVKRSFINDIIKYGKNIETRRRRINLMLNFNVLKELKSLKNLTISFEFVERAFSGVKALTMVYELIGLICERLIKLMPDTVKKLYLNEVPDLNNDCLTSITNKMPFIECLFLKFINEIGSDGLENFKNLKYLYMWREIRIKIPKWVYVVIIDTFSSPFARSIKINPDNTLSPMLLQEANDYYNRYTQRTFNSSFRYISRYGIKYNVFFDVLYDWNCYLWMLDELDTLY